MPRFDCLKSAYRDIVWLANCSLGDTSLKCGLAYVQGNIPIEQDLFDLNGRLVCSIYVPVDFASCTTYSLLSSPNDDIEFQLKLPHA